ncbi:MAG: hypothetical protein ACREPY_10945 [Rhodanobacteraceae bacterium]
MKPQELMTLALRVLAVFIGSQAFIYAADAAFFFVAPSQSFSGLPLSTLVVVGLVGPAVVAVALWWCAPSLAHLAARGITDAPVTKLNVRAVVGATFVAVGTLIFILALPGLVSNIIRSFGPPGVHMLPMLVGSILQCVLGVVLVLGSGVISRLLLRLRYAGTGVPDL